MTTLAPCISTRLQLGLTVAFFALPVAVAPKAEELGHQYYHDSDYRHWKQPGTNISCCSDQDCAPVRAELRQSQWFALRQGKWIAVPDEKIIRVSNPAVESGHLCYSKGKVVCFVPPNTGG